MWLPLLVVALLAAAAVLLSPTESEDQDQSLAEVRIDPDSLADGRQYGTFRLDSIRILFTQIDPKGLFVDISEVEDSVSVRRRAQYPPSRFLRIYQNQRTSEDFRRLKNSPIRMLPGDENGYLAPVTVEKGVRYVTLPYDALAGVLEESGNAEPLGSNSKGDETK